VLHADFSLTVEDINSKQASIQISAAERTIQYMPILVHTMDVTLPKSSLGTLLFYHSNSRARCFSIRFRGFTPPLLEALILDANPKLVLVVTPREKNGLQVFPHVMI
jgi:hypothetical protein